MAKFNRNLKQRKNAAAKYVAAPAISEARLEEIVNNAAKEKAERDNIGFDVALKEMIDQYANARVKGFPEFVNPKFAQIVNDVINTLPEDKKLKAIKEDHILKGYYIDINKAKNENRQLSVAIINRQIEARTTEILLNLGEKELYELLNDGNILDYFTDDDRMKYRIARDTYTLVMDLADYALKDYISTITSLGISCNTEILKKVTDARKAIDEWYSNGMKCYTEKDVEAREDESGNIYDYIKNKRLPVLLRKLDRIKIKTDNEKE